MGCNTSSPIQENNTNKPSINIPSTIHETASRPSSTKSENNIHFNNNTGKDNASGNRIASAASVLTSSRVQLEQRDPFTDDNPAIDAKQVTSFSVAARGVAYEVDLTDASTTSESIVRSHPPRAIKKLQAAHPQPKKLTLQELEERLNSAKERKQKVLQGVKTNAQEIASGKRPKTAMKKEELEKRLQENTKDHMDSKATAAEERRLVLQQEKLDRQRRREEKARFNREKALELQNPDFVDRLDCFGQDGALEAPLSPMPMSMKVPELAKALDESDFFK